MTDDPLVAAVNATLPPMTLIGVMSGTSLDGVDALAARLELTAGHLDWRVLERLSLPYPAELRGRLQRALRPETSDVAALAQLHWEVGEAYAEACARLCSRHGIDAVALSGQTVYHIPGPDEARGWRRKATLQLGEGALVAERCRVPVFDGFRASDMAAGGQGAPMVPFGDLLLYGVSGRARAVHNLGGISNVTLLPADGDPHRVLAFDTGPASCLIDEAAERVAGRAMDEDGRLAAAGRVEERLLARLLQHPYLQSPPPKTTGRETFTLERLWGEDAARLEGPDLLATLTAYSAESLARAYRQFVLPHGLDEVLLAGGGALNPTLVAMIRERLDLPVHTFAELGLEAKDREPLAFAVMAYMAAHGLPNVLPSATGARRPVVAGRRLYPGGAAAASKGGEA